jgi:hypothetical protein
MHVLRDGSVGDRVSRANSKSSQPSGANGFGFMGSAVAYQAPADIGDHHELGSAALRVH